MSSLTPRVQVSWFTVVTIQTGRTSLNGTLWPGLENQQGLWLAEAPPRLEIILYQAIARVGLVWRITGDAGCYATSSSLIILYTVIAAGPFWYQRKVRS